MSPHQPAPPASAPSESRPSSPARLVRGDADARLAALPAGVLALTVHGSEADSLLRARPLSRQSVGRDEPGRPHLGRNRLVGGWTVDLGEVFRDPETEWYALGLGTNALAVNVDLGTHERELNRGRDLPAGRSTVQCDALVFPPLTRGMQPAHGRLVVGRDGRVLFEARDNGSVFDRLGARTLLIPDLEEPEHHPPFDLECGVSVPLQSGSALVPGGSSGSVEGLSGDVLPLLRVAWKPFDLSAGQSARRRAPVERRPAPRAEEPCAWSAGPLG